MSDNEEAPLAPGNEEDNQPAEQPKVDRFWYLKLLIPNKRFLVTPLLIELCFLFYIAMCIGTKSVFEFDSQDLIKWGSNFSPYTLDGQWWRLVTSIFMHGGLLHIALNMFALFYIGLILEGMLGKVRLLVAFMVTGLFASLCSVWWHDITNSVGASGAIMGLFGVFIALLTTDLLDQQVRKGLLKDFVVMVGFNLLIGIRGGIDNAAHMGGLLSGLVVGYAYYPLLKWPYRKWAQIVVPAALVLVTIGIVAFELPRIPNFYGLYDSKIELFSTNERKALEYYKMPASSTIDERLKQLDENGIQLWQQNNQILDTLIAYPKMPSKLVTEAQQLSQYSHLRQQSFQLEYKRQKTQSAIFDDSLKLLDTKIDSVLKIINAKQDDDE